MTAALWRTSAVGGVAIFLLIIGVVSFQATPAAAQMCRCNSGRSFTPIAGQSCAQACQNEGGVAEGGGGGVVRIDNFLGFESIEQFINAVVPKLIAFATSIVTIMVLWAAYQLLFSGANPALVEKAKKTLLWTVVGYAIILLGSGIAFIVKDVLTNPEAGQQRPPPAAGTPT